MDELEKARQTINEIDEQLAPLFVKRMEASKEIAFYKRFHGLPIYDEAREREVLKKCAERVSSEELKNYYLAFVSGLMDLSKQYQTRLLNGMKIAYSGVKGAFAEIAAGRIFPAGTLVGYGDFEEAYASVVSGECDCAVLPIENSYAGTVGRVMDLMFRGELSVSGVYTMPVVQNLLGVPGAQLSDVKRVISHTQALGQCAKYIKKHGFEKTECENTALAAKIVAKENDKSLAAIASAETAKLYDLIVLDHDINESAVNSTRFAVFTRTARKTPDADKFILLFTVNDVAGALASAINVISSHGFNMKALKSRPVHDKAWQYYFYVEAEGDDESENGRRMLGELSKSCEIIKVAGHYKEEILRPEEDA